MKPSPLHPISAERLNLTMPGRHILFFVNWVAWHRRNLPLWRRVLFAAKILSVWAFLIWERIGIALDGARGRV